MQTITATYADEALQLGLQEVISTGLESSSRNGPVLRTPMPLTTTYADPRSRVLFNSVRDANPFLHLFESMWMLQGRNDLAFVQHFTPQMKAYSDDGRTLNGAYGFRWRNHFGFDQLHDFIIQELTKNPETRRAHLGMWDASTDPTSAQTGTADIPCNTSIAFDVIRGRLSMTVFNRSNDLCFGAYGANLVHMSFLLEYVAQATGLKIGNYYQVSNNAHVYVENPATARLITKVDDAYTLTDEYLKAIAANPVPQGMVPTPLLFEHGEIESFRSDLDILFQHFDRTGTLSGGSAYTFGYESQFGIEILAPLGRAYDLYKENKLEDALGLLTSGTPYDWLINGAQWLGRRIQNRKNKETA